MEKEDNSMNYENWYQSNIMNKITMDCLMNGNQKKKLANSGNNDKYDKKDRKFYRRRIINLTREMLLNNESPDLLLDVKETFDNYVKACIGFFKVKDETDIIQADRVNVELEKDFEMENDLGILDLDDIVTPEEANRLMMRSIKINKLPLNGFVTVKNLKITKQPILPIQKDINLKDPLLKNKGIRKKKNMNNQYIENEKEKRKE